MVLLYLCEAQRIWGCSRTLTRSVILLNLFPKLLLTCKQEYRFTLFLDSQSIIKGSISLATGQRHHINYHIYFSRALLSELDGSSHGGSVMAETKLRSQVSWDL